MEEASPRVAPRDLQAGAANPPVARDRPVAEVAGRGVVAADRRHAADVPMHSPFDCQARPLSALAIGAHGMISRTWVSEVCEAKPGMDCAPPHPANKSLVLKKNTP